MRILLLAVLLGLASCGTRNQPVTVHPPDALPGTLSAWNLLFVRGDRLFLNGDVLPYDLNTPLFSDYALKLRTVWMPEGTAATTTDNGLLEFPVGTILSKTFHYRRGDGGFRKLDTEAELGADGSLDLDRHRIVETRLLVHYADGWKAIPYVWNAEQNEAYLAVAGDQFEFRLEGESFAYLVPDMNQCAACHAPNHTTKAIEPLGPKAHQLNRKYAYADGTENQLDRWAETGRLTAPTTLRPASARWSARDSQSPAELARAYLDVNCAHCHNPDGPADTSALNLNLEAPVDRHFGICKPPVAVGRGSGDRQYDIYPGRPDDSILLFRMEHDDPAIMMPELGRAVVHEEGIAVIRAFIASLPGDC